MNRAYLSFWIITDTSSYIKYVVLCKCNLSNLRILAGCPPEYVIFVKGLTAEKIIPYYVFPRRCAVFINSNISTYGLYTRRHIHHIAYGQSVDMVTTLFHTTCIGNYLHIMKETYLEKRYIFSLMFKPITIH